jgi:threonine dehydratase
MSHVYDFETARRAVDSVARRTPLLPASELSDRLGRPVYVKAECLQVTGSFKVRGAAARLSVMSQEERDVGVVACSSGNHGKAVAYVADRLGIPATVCVPEWVDPVKLEGIRSAGAETLLIGETFDESEAHAVELAASSGRVYASAYDDPWVIAGQGTIAAELCEQLGGTPELVVAPLSGGGLVGGIAAAFAARTASAGELGPRVVAVSAKNASVMLESVRAGTPVDMPEVETLANALAGGIGLDNAFSFELIRDLIEDHVTVTEQEIGAAMAYAATALHLVVEGGGAVGLGAALSDTWRPPEGQGAVVIVLSGGNVAPAVLAGVLR